MISAVTRVSGWERGHLGRIVCGLEARALIRRALALVQ